MSRLDNCLTAIVGDKLPIETARKTFFFLLGIAVMLIVIALPSPSPFYKGEEAIPLTANAKIVMAVLCFAVIQWMTEAIPFPFRKRRANSSYRTTGHSIMPGRAGICLRRMPRGNWRNTPSTD